MPVARFELGYPRTELRRRLVEAVLDGRKTATSSLRREHAPATGDALPRPGDEATLVRFDGEALGVVRTTAVAIVKVGDVDLQFARDEGEGFQSVAEWRAAHERFWEGDEITDDTLIVCQRFELVERC